MGWIAIERLKWGDGYLEPGDAVPDGEDGRDYAGLERLHQIARSNGPGEGVDAALDQARQDLAAAEKERDEALANAQAVETLSLERLARAEALEVERDELAKQVEDLTAPDEAPSEAPPGDDDALPEGVTELGGGWYQIADGPKVHGRQALTDALAAK